jgi:hypothetical protein
MAADFDDIRPGARLKGLDAVGVAEVVSVSRFGPDALNLVFRVDGHVGERLVYRGEESAFEFVDAGRIYAFDADGGLLRLASEAYRIRLAYLFDPYLAVSASQIEALPHQITAVYGEMLPRQPLRFLLADDPGAGKTIMGGLLIKELLIRGDLERCLIVAPGGLVEQSSRLYSGYPWGGKATARSEEDRSGGALIVIVTARCAVSAAWVSIATTWPGRRSLTATTAAR